MWCRLHLRGLILQPMWAVPAVHCGDDSGEANPCSACVGRITTSSHTLVTEVGRDVDGWNSEFMQVRLSGRHCVRLLVNSSFN